MSSILDNPAIRQAAVPVTVEQYHRMGDAGLIYKNTELLSLPGHSIDLNQLFG